MKVAHTLDLRLPITGLSVAPSQRFGALRLVPLVRDKPVEKLRLDRVPPLEREPAVAGEKPVVVVVPHGVLAHWESGVPCFSIGTRVSVGSDLDRFPPLDLGWSPREDGTRVRFAPLALLQESLIVSSLGAPSARLVPFVKTLRPELLRATRLDASAEEALRTFEPYDGQCGVLVYAADTLLAAVVLPHADDYALVHRAIVTDALGPWLKTYGASGPVRDFAATLDGRAVRTLDDLRTALNETRARWASPEVLYEGKLLPAAASATDVKTVAGFATARFTTPLLSGGGTFIGDAVYGRDRALASLVMLRLSAAQSRRMFFMQLVVMSQCNLKVLAGTLRAPIDETARRVKNNGCNYLIDAK